MKKLIAVSVLLIGLNSHANVCQVAEVDNLIDYTYASYTIEGDDRHCSKAMRACNAVLKSSLREGTKCVAIKGLRKKSSTPGWNTSGYEPKPSKHSPGYWTPVYGI